MLAPPKNGTCILVPRISGTLFKTHKILLVRLLSGTKEPLVSVSLFACLSLPLPSCLPACPSLFFALPLTSMPAQLSQSMLLLLLSLPSRLTLACLDCHGSWNAHVPCRRLAPHLHLCHCPCLDRHVLCRPHVPCRLLYPCHVCQCWP